MRVRALTPALAALASLLRPATAAAQDVPVVSLSQAVAWALERNPSAVVALEEVRRAQAVVEESRSASLPTLAGTAAFTQLDGARQVGPVVSQPQTGLLLQATLAVPIIVPRSWAQWSQSKELLRSAEASSADVRRVVAVGVARAYLAIVAQKRVIDAATRARDTDKAHFDFAHQRYVGGVGNRIDEVRAEQQLSSDEANVEVQLTMLAREREVLGVLVGVGGPLDAEEPNLQVSGDPAHALEDADRRTDVRTGQARLKAAEHVVHDDWTDYSPYLTGSFSPFVSDPATVNYPNTGWQAQLVLTIPFYDGGLRYALQKERSLEAARRASELGRRGLELAQIAYRAGATTNLEVIDAERTARDAETAVAVAEDGARQARLDLLAATGRFP